MAHHKSALKRVRQTIKRTAQKRSQRADLRTVIKKFRLILDGGNMDQAREAYSGVQKNIDKAVTRVEIPGFFFLKSLAPFVA